MSFQKAAPPALDPKGDLVERVAQPTAPAVLLGARPHAHERLGQNMKTVARDGEPDEEIVILEEAEPAAVATDLVQRRTTDEDRGMDDDIAPPQRLGQVLVRHGRGLGPALPAFRIELLAPGGDDVDVRMRHGIIVLQAQPVRHADVVGIHTRDKVARADADAGVEGAGETEVFGQAQHGHATGAPIAVVAADDLVLRLGHGAVDHEHDLIGRQGLGEDALERGGEIVGRFAAIGRHEDADTGQGSAPVLRRGACGRDHRAPARESTTRGVRSRIARSPKKLRCSAYCVSSSMRCS